MFLDEMTPNPDDYFKIGRYLDPSIDIGLWAMVRDLVEQHVEDIVQYDPYEDELQNVKMLPILDE